MAIIRLFRLFIFILITVFSLVVLGICAHIEYLVTGYTDLSLSFAPFGLGTACLTIISLPLFLVLGNLRHRVFTSMILFEIIWFFVLWILWVGTASDTVAGKAYHFPAGCVYNNYPTANQICDEFTVVEAFAFLNFFCAFIYYDAIFLYAIINAIRGRGIWTASVKEATTGTPVAVNPGVPIVQAQFNAAPAVQYQNYGVYPQNVPPTQPYNAYPQQLPPQGPPAQPYNAYPQQLPPQGPPAQPYNAYPQQLHPQGPPAQPYHAYPQQVPPQSPPSQHYNTYPQQAPPQGFSTIPPGQNQSYNYTPSPGAPQQQVNYAGYSPSPTTKDASLPPQPNYNSYPVSDPQVQLPLPTAYQGQPPAQSPYGSHQPVPV